MVIGLIAGGAIFLLLSSIVLFVCCVLVCGAKHGNRSDQGTCSKEEKAPTPVVGTISPDVIQMESSPKMYRKRQFEDAYVSQSNQYHQNHKFNHTAAYNPYIINEEGEDIAVLASNQRQFVSTPPAYLGNPATRFY